MTTMTFEFNYEKLQKDGKTADDILKPMREHAKKFGIQETEYGVFSKSGSDAMWVIVMFSVNHTMEDLSYISYLTKWEVNIDGVVEDCIIEAIKNYRRLGMKIYEDVVIPEEEPYVEEESYATLEFVFNEERLREENLTEDRLLAPMRAYANKNNVKEISKGFFRCEGKDAMCIMTSFAVEFSMENPRFLTYLDKWELDVDGEVEDVIEESKKHLRLERRSRWSWDW